MLKYLRISILIFLPFVFAIPAFSQNPWQLGAEYNYSCGQNLSQQDIGIRYDNFKNKGSWNVGVSYNWGHTKSKERSKESGISISAGYRYGFNFNAKSNMFAGIKATWEIDNWKDNNGKNIAKESVIIPKIEAGYQRFFGDLGHLYGAPAVGLGYALHTKAEGDGKSDDEGLRYLIGLSVGYRH